MSEIENGRLGLYGTTHSKCNHLVTLGFKGLMQTSESIKVAARDRPVGVGAFLGSGSAGQRRRVKDSTTAALATETGAGTERHGHRTSFSVSDTLRHGKDPAVDDDHDNER